MFTHPSLSKCLELIDQIHQQSFGKNYGLLLTGLSGVGKTYLAKTYQARFPTVCTPEVNYYPVIYVKLTETKTATDFLIQIVKSLTSVIGKSANKAHIVQDRLAVLLTAHRVQLIIIDEVQECLTDIDGITSQRMAKQIAALLDNNPKVSVVLMGTPVASRLLRLKYGKLTHRLKGEEQLSRRFLSEQRLHIIPSRCECWLLCCNYCATQLGLPPFTLNNKPILNRLHVATDGRIGLLTKLFAIASTSKHKNLLAKLEDAYLLGINSSAYNPFDTIALSDDDIIGILDSREFD
ncbi:ATP-binding protein [uncultured Pseudoalteromonas sp.]|uniref:ATP-binding protein n=1 Tax=uncultured Pseudoalteromonas sp. TaxID=114053 RepID=UPI0025D8784C|nr:ATP-binding protein [uncultured Pseudoalteromonas sp.]|tara:strand:- start:7078 stop:7956 length:879 start_codon:yes stop_codon:yes gene_type:complete